MANQKPDAGHFADAGFLIFGAFAQLPIYPARKTDGPTFALSDREITNTPD
jgi:hypothetical protein